MSDKTDLFTLNADGTTTVHLMSKNVTLKRPTLGQFRALREKLEAAQDRATPQATELQNEAIDIQSEAAGASTEELAERLAAMRVKTRAVRQDAETMREMFFVEAIAMLNVKTDEVIDPDDFPPQVLADQWIAELIDHWRSRPTVPSAS